MGLLVDGAWQDVDMRTQDGHFVRKPTAFHNYVTADGSPGPTGKGGFPAEARPLSSLCIAGLPVGAPHAHLPQAQEARRRDLGFGHRSAVRQEGLGIRHRARRDARHRQRQIDASPTSMSSATRTIAAAPACPCSGTRSSSTIVNNESSEIIRMLNSAFDAFTDVRTDYYPASAARRDRSHQRSRLSDRQQRRLSLGFATTQAAYEEAARALFATLDQLEERLSRQRYLAGAQITEADWRLFTTLVRFDAVYYSHFKCNLRRIIDYPNLWNYLRDFIRCRASPRPSVSITSSGTITAATATSTRPASCRSAR